MTSDLMDVSPEYLRLFKAGKDAARAGENNRAHEFFRQAIELDPYREQAWLWLASVVETDEDRRVCFENVLELNPGNTTARRQLQKLEQRIVEETLGTQIKSKRSSSGRKKGKQSAPPPSRRGKWSFRLLLVTLIIFLSIAAALIINYT